MYILVPEGHADQDPECTCSVLLLEPAFYAALFGTSGSSDTYPQLGAEQNQVVLKVLSAGTFSASTHRPPRLFLKQGFE
jgi:hypothetical protein